jgi:hypothetical protein
MDVALSRAVIVSLCAPASSLHPGRNSKKRC